MTESTAFYRERRAPLPPFSAILGTDQAERLAIGLTLISMALYLFCLVAEWIGVSLNLVDATQSLWLTIVALGGEVAFYVLLRSGISRRWPDPTLSLPQMVFAITLLGAAYLINPQVRGELLMLAALVLEFGAFQLPPRRCRDLGWFAVAVFGVAMAIGATVSPDRFDPRIEAFQFALMLAFLPVIAGIAGKLSQMRVDQKQQRRQLRDALKQVQILATRDELTGLPNRRHALELIERETARACRSGAPLCVAILDLDHFKRINDTFGHGVGDEVLRTFGREGRLVLRADNIFARWGGEEFILVMPDSTLIDAQTIVRRLREHMASPECWASCLRARTTFSAGIAEFLVGETLDETFIRADAALYEAKKLGRDLTMTA